MSHMVADTDAELHRMADALGVSRRWFQGDHYDICQSNRERALKLGAVGVSYRQLGCMVHNRRATGTLGDPATAVSTRRSLRRDPSLDDPNTARSPR
ncbi:DUF4031 domain-containing protein [Bosea sp. RAC05]|uniref:DUF4031 domain-containing protein n=1 Tax=Bosea sp. RAC05 TaxID=1842539 RepID=UPI001F1C3C8B|nr:DUF4031 domain-containing protein [Bosea sp. RAC05]